MGDHRRLRSWCWRSKLVLVWDQLAKAWKSLYSADWWWVLAAVGAALASMHSFAQIQRTLLESAGVHVQAVAFGGGVLRRQCAVHHDARRPGVVGHLHLPPATDLGRVAGGGVVAVGDVGCTAGGGPGVARISAARSCSGASKNPLSLIFTLGGFVALLLLAQAVAIAAGTDRRDRRAGAVVGELAARQARRHRAGQMARNAGSAGIGQPEPPRSWASRSVGRCSIGRRTSACLLFACLCRRRASVAGGADRRLRRGTCGRGRSR